MLKRSKYISALGVLALLVGCQSVIQENVTEQITAKSINNKDVELTARTIKGWQDHLKSAKSGGELQKDCSPFFKLAKENVKGSVMLFHGYSACPQQYNEVAAELADIGYNVFVPLLPGHGRVPVKSGDKVIDNSENLPDVKSTVIYEKFAANMGLMLKDEPGTKVIGGLSVGGVIASRAMLANPDIYDRGFLMAPFFNAAGPVSLLIPAVEAIMPNKSMGWGEKCENQRRLGRAGYCDFKVTNIAAVRRFGLDTLKDVGNIKKPMQIIGVEKDPAASNSAIAEAVKKLPNSDACFFAEGASHSMLSRQDNVSTNMFWLAPLKQQMIRYIDTGKGFDIGSKSEHGLGQCRSY